MRKSLTGGFEILFYHWEAAEFMSLFDTAVHALTFFTFLCFSIQGGQWFSAQRPAEEGFK